MSPTDARATLGSARPCPTRLTPPLGPDDHVDGPADAPLELVMYGDFQCPFCTAAQPILRRVRDRLDDRLRFAFRHFPLRTRPPRRASARREAREAAAAQGAFWPMHDALYGLRGRLGVDDVVARGRRARARRRAVRAELAAGHARRAGRRPTSRAARAGGVRGTPTFFANGVRHEGAFDAQSLIAALEGR